MALFAPPKILPDDLPLEGYRVELPLERLQLGVDNLRYDVHISPEFVKETEELTFQLILKYADVSSPLQTRGRIQWHQEISRFKNSCREMMTHAVNVAKSRQEIQIDYLAQVAIAKLVVEDIDNRFEAAVQHFKSVVRKQEVSRRTESQLNLREEVASVLHRRNPILQQVSEDLLSWFEEARRDLDALRSSIFGQEDLLPGELFENPLLRSLHRPDDFFMLQHYVLLGHRIEDPLNYKHLLSVIIAFLSRLRASGPARSRTAATGAAEYGGRILSDNTADRLLKRVENMDLLFNYLQTDSLITEEKSGNRDANRLRELRKQSRVRKELLGRLHRAMRKEKLLRGIVAAYEIFPAVGSNCPPLTPQEVLQYVVFPKMRKPIARKIARFNRYSDGSQTLSELKKTATAARWASASKVRENLIRFMKDFAAYHRDQGNYALFRETVDCVHIVRDEKTLRLSRDNHTLHEVMLPRERTLQKAPIIRHVVIKADVRGSTGIIDQMKEKGMNPASNFSLNFFDPIRHLTSVYGAQKVFIEGDAVILSISEHEGAPDRWYGVARACGLAASIITIVRRYNVQNRQNRLPRLDLGIGISFCPFAPTFFYDGESPIMISPAINEADVLSECDRVLRNRMSKPRPPFNVYVHEIDTGFLENPALLNSAVYRYNVMGIELSAAAFEKLSEEIHLHRFEAHLPDLQEEPFTAYTGKFPTQTGNFQRIILREADIPVVSPRDYSILRMSGRKYYEVCTQPKLYDYVKQMK